MRVASALADVHPAFERPAVIVLHDAASVPRATSPRPLWGVPVLAADDAALTDKVTAILDTPRRPAFTCAVPSIMPDASSSTPPALGLTMIVRNEADTIAQTAASALPHIDGWTIVDTGSTDGTIAAIKRTPLFRAVPGNLSSSAFVDFAVTRNEALRAHGTKTAYVFMPDAEFGFVGLWRLRLLATRLVEECGVVSHAVCIAGLKITRSTPGVDVGMVVGFPTQGERERQRSIPVAALSARCPQTRHAPPFSPSAVGTPSAWHYRYPVHEVSSFRDTYHRHVIDVPRYVRMQSLGGVDVGAKSPRRWLEFDLPVLRKAVAATPNDTRVVFYLARTLQAVRWEKRERGWSCVLLAGETTMGRRLFVAATSSTHDPLFPHQVNLTDEALEVYARRAALGGWPQEVFYSHYERGRILADTRRCRPDGRISGGSRRGRRPHRALHTAGHVARWPSQKVRRQAQSCCRRRSVQARPPRRWLHLRQGSCQARRPPARRQTVCADVDVRVGSAAAVVAACVVVG